MNRIRNASLIQRERLPEKRFPTTGDLLILKILLILDILFQTTENVGKHTSLSTTAGGALAKRANRGFTGARLETAPTRCIETRRSLLQGTRHSDYPSAPEPQRALSGTRPAAISGVGLHLTRRV